MITGVRLVDDSHGALVISVSHRKFGQVIDRLADGPNDSLLLEEAETDLRCHVRQRIRPSGEGRHPGHDHSRDSPQGVEAPLLAVRCADHPPHVAELDAVRRSGGT
jgi:hypothetical protein